MSSIRAHFDPATESGRAELLQALRAGRVAALPTETVPGLGVLAGSEAAHRALAETKGSPADRPFTLHLRGPQDLRRFLPAPPPGLAAWLDRRLPGPLTAGHHQLVDACEACHLEPFGGGEVLQEACEACHGDERRKPFDSPPTAKFTDAAATP